MDLNVELFGKKTFSSLLKDIYDNQKKKDSQIKTLLSEIKPHLTGVPELLELLPVIKDFMEISVKNDDQLVKMAAIVQRLIGSSSDQGSSQYLSDSEKDELIANIREVGDTLKRDNKPMNKESVIGDSDGGGST